MREEDIKQELMLAVSVENVEVIPAISTDIRSKNRSDMRI